MPKKARELSAIEVKRLATKKGRHAVGGVAGLLLSVSSNKAASWLLRYSTGEIRTSSTGKPFVANRDLGLGSYPDIGLAQARELARAMREKLANQIDPVMERKAAKQARLAELKRLVTFEEAAKHVIRKKQAESSNAKHAYQWERTLEVYAYPTLGKMAVADIELGHITKALLPIWEEKTETASRVRQRIEAVLSWATVHGYREGDNPARWKGNLDAVLPAPSKVAKVQHLRALPIDEMPDFMLALKDKAGTAADCLAFTILTATRSGEARGATWEEIDLENKLWVIPAERMKADKEHRVPLSSAVLELLKQQQPATSGFIFPSASGKPLSDVAMTQLLKRMKVHDRATVHGFRSTFRDWTAERTATPHHVAEMALAHSIGNAVEAAYRRGDLLAKRAKLMQQWADFITQPPMAKVTPLNVNTEAREA
ncbi:tyrosine-type recombinase/integrase [Marinospirillum sp. MEB164]|uniref:Tyrosine-type recombinase/integrase n=1 Tax=Marinospirillum alkalitolerans TaxID=3123374 RepID=A0ABW8PVD7_9GAMM